MNRDLGMKLAPLLAARKRDRHLPTETHRCFCGEINIPENGLHQGSRLERSKMVQAAAVGRH